MKAHSLGYLTKEGFRNIRVNRLMSLASVTVLLSCLVIIGGAFMIFLNINSVLDGIEHENVIMVFVKDEAGVADTEQVGRDLTAIDNVAVCEFIPKADAYKMVLDSMGTDASLLEGVTSDFLPDAYKLTLRDMSRFNETVASIKQVKNTGAIRENSALADKLTEIRNSITYVCVGIIVLLFLVALFIIANTVRITMFSRKLEISIMKAVGATNSFIRWPFIIEGMTLGLISACVAEGVLYVLYTAVSNQFASMIVLFDSDLVSFASAFAPTFIAFIIIGVFTGTFGSAISMGKYLKEQGSVISIE